MKTKSIFKSKTILGAVVAIAASSVSVAPKAEACLRVFDANTAADLLPHVAAIIGGMVAIKGRMDAQGPLYTPKGFPGPNKPNLEVKEDEPIDLW